MTFRKIAVYGLVIMAFSVGSVVYDHYQRSANEEKFSAALAKIMHEANKDTPRMIDESTRLEYVTIEGRSTIAMRYTLPYIQVHEIDTQAFMRGVKPAATKQVCGGGPSRQFLKSGGSYGYEYADDLGRRIIKFIVTETDCT